MKSLFRTPTCGIMIVSIVCTLLRWRYASTFSILAPWTETRLLTVCQTPPYSSLSDIVIIKVNIVINVTISNVLLLCSLHLNIVIGCALCAKLCQAVPRCAKLCTGVCQVDWEGLGRIGKDWEALGRIARHWEGLGRIGKRWEGSFPILPNPSKSLGVPSCAKLCQAVPGELLLPN